MNEAKVLEALPSRGFLKNYVEYAMTRTDAHACYHLAGGLAILAQTVHPMLSVEIHGRLFPTLYELVVGASTDSRKSTAVQIARNVLLDAIPGSIGIHPDSPQGLVKRLAMRPQQLLAYDEFGHPLAQMQSAYLRALKTKLTEAYDNSPLSRGLAKNDTIVQNPRLSILGGVAPEFLEDFTESLDWMGGFLARFTFFYANRERFLSPSDTPPDDRDRRSLLVAQVKERRKAGEAEVPPARCLGMRDKSAGEVVASWWSGVKRKELNPLLYASRSRAPSFVLKIAALIAWDLGSARNEEPWSLSEVELTAATKIVDFHIDSILKFGESLAATESLKNRRRVLSTIPADYSVPLHHVIHHSKLHKQEVLYWIESLKEERIVDSEMVAESGRVELSEFFKQAPYVAYRRASDPDATGATIIQFPRPPSQVPSPSSVEDAADLALSATNESAQSASGSRVEAGSDEGEDDPF